jgi:hypothetical protein
MLKDVVRIRVIMSLLQGTSEAVLLVQDPDTSRTRQRACKERHTINQMLGYESKLSRQHVVGI